MKKQIDIRLSNDSIEGAIKQIRQYKAELKTKSAVLMQKLAEVGVQVINMTISSIPSEEADGAAGKYLGILEQTDESVTVAYALTGSKAAFIEFSAGITYGSPPGSYPLPSGAAYGAGTYNPDSDNWKNPDGWFYGDGKHTYGNRAYMPAYHSTEAIALEVGRIAKEVFG